MQSAGTDLTPTGWIKEASIAQVCDWSPRSWNGVKKEVVVKQLKKYSISNTMDGTEDDEMYWVEESDPSEDTGNVEIEEDDILLILTVMKSSCPSIIHKYCKFVTGT